MNSVSERVNVELGTRALEGQLRRFDALLGQINESADAKTRAKLEEVIRLLMELHGMALERLLDMIWESSPEGQGMIDNLAQDDLVGSLLMIHGLHPLSLETRVSQALEKVRPYMHSHGGDVELLEITENGVIRLRLDGTCHGCPSSRVTLKFAVEKAIYDLAPDAAAIEVEGVEASEPVFSSSAVAGNPYIQIDGEITTRQEMDGWMEVQGLDTLTSGTTRVQQVSGQTVLFCRLEDVFYAYGSACPKCGQFLGQAKLEGKDLTCQACSHRYDILRAGRDLDDPSLHLNPLPLLKEKNQIRVAVPAR